MSATHVGPLQAAADFSAYTYYVDAQNGNNTNDGLSAGTALKTLEYAMETLARTQLNNGNAVQVLLAPGTYYESKISLNTVEGGDLNAAGEQAPLRIVGLGNQGDVRVSGAQLYAPSSWTLVDASNNVWSHSWTKNWGHSTGYYYSDDLITQRREQVYITDPGTGERVMLRQELIEQISMTGNPNNGTAVYSWVGYQDPRTTLDAWDFGVAEFGSGETINGIAYSSTMHNSGGGTADDNKLFVRLPNHLTFNSAVRAGTQVAANGVEVANVEELFLVEKSNLEMVNLVFESAASRSQQSGQYNSAPVRIGGEFDGVIDRNILLKDVVVRDNSGAGLYMGGVEDVVLDNVDITDNGFKSTIRGDRMIIVDMDVTGNNWRGGRAAFQVHTTGGVGIAGVEHTYINSHFDANWGIGWRQDIHSENFLIAGSTFNNNIGATNPFNGAVLRGDGIEMEATPEGPVTFVDSQFNGNDGYGAFLLTVSNTTFIDSQFAGNGLSAMGWGFQDRTDVPIMGDEPVNDWFISNEMTATGSGKIHDWRPGGDRLDYLTFIHNGFHGQDNVYHASSTNVFANDPRYSGTGYTDFAGWLTEVRTNFPTNETGSVWANPTGIANVAPVLTDGQSFTVRAHMPERTLIGRVAVADANAGVKDMTWSITAGNGSGAFSVDQWGFLWVNNSAALTAGAYNLTISANDAGLSDQTQVGVTVAANVAPVGHNETYEIATTATNGTVVGKIDFVDPFDMATLSYAIIAGNDGSFAVGSDGTITVANASLLNTSGSYTLTVRATDAGGLSDTAVATINFAGANASPLIQPGQVFTVAENAAIGTSLGTISASDPDVGQTLSYSISGDDGGYGIFQVNVSTGEITVIDNAGLDYSTRSTYDLIVTVTDSGSPTRSDTETITINVTEVLNAQGTYGNGGAAWAIAASGATRLQAENYDTGGQGIAYHDSTSGNAGSQYRTEDVDVQTTTDSGGGHNVGWTAGGEWLEYTINVAQAGLYDISLRVASNHSNPGSVDITSGGSLLGNVDVAPTGGWQNWTTVTLSGVSLAAGEQVLRLDVLGGNFNINWIEFTSAADTTAPATPSGLSAIGGNGQVTLDWANNSEPDLAGYNVYRATSQGGSYAKLNGSLVTSSAYTDSSVTNGTTYWYKVTAVDNAATPNESAQTSAVSATPTVPVVLPTPIVKLDFTNGSGNQSVVNEGSLTLNMQTPTYTSDTPSGDGYAGDFHNGTDIQSTVSDPSAWDNNKSYTVTGWVKAFSAGSTSGFETFFGNGNAGRGVEIGVDSSGNLAANGANLGAWDSGAGGYTDLGFDVTTDGSTWEFFALVADFTAISGGSMTMHVYKGDGATLSHTTVNVGTWRNDTNNSTHWYVGTGGRKCGFDSDALIDDVRYYGATDGSMALTQAQIQAIMLEGAAALQADTANSTVADEVVQVQQSDLQPLINAATRQFKRAGYDIREFGDNTYVIADLPGDMLASYANDVITIDIDAAGFGWFVDQTPMSSSEFRGRKERPQGMDLLTAIVHELGHDLGLSHSDTGAMQESLATGERHRIQRAIPASPLTALLGSDLLDSEELLIALA